MLRFTRRPSDTVAFTVIYWISLLFSTITLIFFAKDRIEVVLRREYVLLTSKVDATSERPYVAVPDVIICMNNTALQSHPESYLANTIRLSDPSIPRGYTVQTPCPEQRNHDTMFVFWSRNGTIDVLNTSNVVFSFKVNSPENERQQAIVYILPPEHNIFRERVLVPEGNNSNPDAYLQRNQHFISQGEGKNFINARIEKTKVLRSDFWGYFNEHNKTATEYIASSLLLSIPSALGSFGGLLSLASALLIIFFGSGRLAPFGVIQSCFMRSSTKARIKGIYGAWKQDMDNSGTIQGRHDSTSFLQQQPHPEESVATFQVQLKRQEKRLMEMETLLKEFYLDMELVDTSEDAEGKRDIRNGRAIYPV
ncbi:hypothetical protein BGZ65_000258 [Modicella reniformis]|uniref:Uncharacterized protein n=1 Tax=Modicella reniformis TaxID=1440133 RepID=A0A9P6J6V3_9FUNG|nr:hypothetical protein BGZ65_000258 [Modicella reniformis]